MDRSKVRIGLFTTGIIAGLTLILYLPVLIWSPPWGEDGCYIYEHKDTNHFMSIEFINGRFKTVIKNEIETQIGQRTFKRTNETNIWVNTQDFNYSIKVDGRHLQYNPRTPKGLRLVKTSNPFTLWYIKWLEWTSN